MTTGGGRFDFDDGGSYIGNWQDGKAHGLGLCTGPKGQGEYAGEWTDGFESLGVYIWPSGNTYEGTWTKGKRHGEGVETKGRWIYKGEWTTGFKGRYGAREALTSAAKYEGSWVTGMQDGYGVETYADGGTYSGQWLRGTRNGYGVRQSATFAMASHYRDERNLRESLTSLRSIDESETTVKDREKKLDEARGGFVLRAYGEDSPSTRRKSIFEKKSSLKKTFLGKLKKQRSTGDICESPRGGRSGGSIRSAYSNVSDASAFTDTLHPPHMAATLVRNPDTMIPGHCSEVYRGEWKNDKRSGYGVCERTDGLKYEGEWFNNKKAGYGITYFPDGTTEEGKYKNDCLVTASGKKSKLFALRTSKLRERVEGAVQQGRQAAQIALQKAEMASNRQSLAREKSDLSDARAKQARTLAHEARIIAKDYAPDFHQPGEGFMKKREEEFPSYVHGALPSTRNGGAAATLITPKRPDRSSNPWTSPNLEVEPPAVMRNPSPVMQDSLKLDNTSETLEVSGGSRRGSFRSSFRRSPSRSNADGGGASGLGASDFGSPSHHGPRHGGQEEEISAVYSSQSHSAAGGGRSANHLAARHHAQQRRHNQQHSARLDDMLNSTLLNDHFDQYSTLERRGAGPPGPGGHHRDSGFGRESSLDDSMPSSAGMARCWAGDSEAGDSGVSELSSVHSRGSRTRRRTLPSIMTTPPVPAINVGPAPITRSPINIPPDHVRSEEDLHGTFIIENGIRKRVQAEAAATAGGPGPLLLGAAAAARPGSRGATAAFNGTDAYEEFPAQEKLAPLPRNYRIESQLQLRKDLGEGSLPDVSRCREIQREGLMTREEVSRLSQARRQELLHELERRKQGEIVIRLADIKDWCVSHVLVLVVFAVNSILAYLFIRLLTSNPSTRGSS